MLKFLEDLQKNNERDWFARHDAVYRYVWKNFGEFTEAVLNDIMEKVDDTVPWLPTKDLVYRIYRDVRFSNDKTPYKTNLMASFSREEERDPSQAITSSSSRVGEASLLQAVGNQSEKTWL